MPALLPFRPEADLTLWAVPAHMDFFHVMRMKFENGIEVRVADIALPFLLCSMNVLWGFKVFLEYIFRRKQRRAGLAVGYRMFVELDM